MIGKLGLIGVGYVLGARAGRDRYEQIRVVAKQAAGRLEKYGAGGTLASRIADLAARGDVDRTLWRAGGTNSLRIGARSLVGRSGLRVRIAVHLTPPAPPYEGWEQP